MPDLDINDLASQGVINDVKPYMLPPEAWTLANNIRYTDGSPEAILGWEAVFGAPIEAPHFLLPIPTQSTNYWIHAGLTKIEVFDGATHANISRAVGGAYTATETKDFSGTVLGGIPIINNGNDVPQFRADMAPATLFANLTNWDGTWRTKVMRSFRYHLVAFNMTKGGVSQPHTMNWSHPAVPGAVPISWDDTDATVDAGIKDFEDVNAGILRDAMPFGGTLYIYKDNATWKCVYVGGTKIFDFDTFLETSGILGPRCVRNTGDGLRQMVVTQDDIIYHRGSQPVSILDKRQRASLFGEIDVTNYLNSFLLENPLRNEMWFCYPTTGNTHPNKAMIWNYREGGERGVISFADGITFRHGAIGNVEGDTSELWSEGTDTWEEDTGPWSEFSRRRLVTAGTGASKFYNMDRTNTRDGASITSTLQRVGISLIGRKRGGEWIVDHQQRKMLHRLWPKISGSDISIRLGTQDTVDGPITWGPAVVFDPAAKNAADNDPVSGAALALELSQTSKSWRADGYKIGITPLGQF